MGEVLLRVKVTQVIMSLLFSCFCIFLKLKTVRNKNFRKYTIFKKMREDYKKDKISGSFAIQNYLNLRLSIYEINFILNSYDAYSILKKIKNTNGNYIFDNGKYISKYKGWYIFSVYFAYFMSFMGLSLYVIFNTVLIEILSKETYVYFFIILIAILGASIIHNLISISEISAVKDLVKITSKKN